MLPPSRVSHPPAMRVLVTTPATATAPVKNASVWEDFVDIFYAPVSVFMRRRDGRWLLPLLVYTLLSAGIFFALRPMMQPMMDRQLAQQVEAARARGASPAQIEQTQKIGRAMTDSPWAMAPIVIMIPITVFLIALGLWVVSKLFGSTQSLGQSMTIATYANFPRVLVGIVSVALLYASGSEGISSQYAVGLSPAALMPSETSPYVLALLSRLELGTVWTTVLLAVGVYVIGRVSKSSAALTAIGVWLLATLLVIGQASMQA
jgi:hypothetical protein